MPGTTAEDLTRVGGKAVNLMRLARAGLPVPAFVVLETGEYRAFVAEAGLTGVVEDALGRDPAEASALIRAAFAAAPMGAAQRDRLTRLVEPFTDGPVAVRSSATAEDLPGLSFAGQQDSFLEVRGMAAVLEAIVSCWSSVWTERAIAYRERNGVDHTRVAVAVIVQRMVAAEAAGVLFTANPRTGRRDESVLDAVRGLGEALVAGRVTPDNLVVDTATGAVREQDLAGPTPVLSAEQVRALVALGRRVQGLFGEPQDIEWAIAGQDVQLLQSRVITSLYPLPEPSPHAGDLPELWLSFGAVQGVLGPMTPLGQDMVRAMVSGAALLVGRRVDWRTARFAVVAGERLWLRISPLLRNRVTRSVVLRVLPLADPASAGIVVSLAREPGFAPRRLAPRWTTVVALARFAARLAPSARVTLADPRGGRLRLEAMCESLVVEVADDLAAAGRAPTPAARLAARLGAVHRSAERFFPRLLPAFGPIMLLSVATLGRLRELARRSGLPDADALALQVLRSLPGNVTTEMDLQLADAAGTIRGVAEARNWVVRTPPPELARQYLAGELPVVAQDALATFLARYGMRGPAEIDLGAPRWRDDPTPVLQSLRAYVAAPAGQPGPRAVHHAGEQEAGRAVQRLMDASTPANRARVEAGARRIRGMFGARETPKFTVIRAFGLIRDALVDSGRDLHRAGRIQRVDDVFYLHLDELPGAFDEEWRDVVAARRAVFEAERRRGQVPRILVSDGRALYEGLGSSGDLTGQGVSPGVAEGKVRVVLDPGLAGLEPGDILVCPGTDPSWTPLFLTAGGLVTEVGGLMTHGSVVAREYGLPAVVGVHEATTRLTEGRRVRIDGASGAIELL